MIPHDALVNVLRHLDFHFKRQADRVELYRKKRSTLRVAIRRRDYHDEDYVKIVLKQAGMAPAEISTFIATCRTGRN